MICKCGHRHRGKDECPGCKCGHLEEYEKILQEEKPMARKIWEWVCWPFKKVWNWLKSCLPNG